MQAGTPERIEPARQVSQRRVVREIQKIELRESSQDREWRQASDSIVGKVGSGERWEHGQCAGFGRELCTKEKHVENHSSLREKYRSA